MQTKQSQMSAKERFQSFSNGKCPYCRGKAELNNSKKKHGGKVGKCLDPLCGAVNFFSNKNLIGG